MRLFNALTTFLAVAASAVIASPLANLEATAELAAVVDKRGICDAPTGSCAFYKTCLEDKYKCGEKGYPLNYGYKYCKKFADAKSKFSTKGQTWVTNTMKCLQKKLVSHTSGSTCTKLEKAAFASHSTCYLSNGVCDLSLGDLWDIFWTVGIGGLFGGIANLKEAAQTAAPCLVSKLDYLILV
ncbi:hypothetical protein BJ508DRAFT_417762 [Ascobolus immersus RN42]|uniref:Extracellular membrane protein CFEM domain-containing protein n=1 Tax=Ascobolus immersus RN42 TaxID=1160509 RepID=A0A3N4HSR1_ASCIM|nr:hypothetical protein BJ508DRAFT_417762 [Ascobolus immersus RN42]